MAFQKNPIPNSIRPDQPPTAEQFNSLVHAYAETRNQLEWLMEAFDGFSLIDGEVVRSGDTDGLRQRVQLLAKDLGEGGSGDTLPWKVTANGDDTVTVGAGAILSFPDGDDLTLSRYKDYAGGDIVTVTTDGFIYGYIDASLGLYAMATPTGTDSGGDTITLYLNRIFPDVADDISVAFAATIPLSNNIFYFEIAEVTLTDGVAAISSQTLNHNPTLWGFKEPP